MRKASRTLKDVLPEILEGLNQGKLETLNLVEGLAIDFSILMQATHPQIPFDVCQTLKSGGITKRMADAGNILFKSLGLDGYKTLIQHKPDTVRGWAAYHLATANSLSLSERLEHILPLANDPHFGVREWAWIAQRPYICENIHTAIDLLTPWISHESDYVRRFAVEITRPRGVWCKHIPVLKDQPELGLGLLSALKKDPSVYVQNSVANWLNDASKTQPEWVKSLCKSWKSDHVITNRICKRAQRSITL
jgi:3-methyladenine DNA glycosylase AlkC